MDGVDGWINHQVRGCAQHRAHGQSLGAPPLPKPREWLKRSHSSHQVTMRHIQLYFIIVKSRTPAEGRIPYLSRKQRLRLKSLFLRSNYVTLS